MLDRSPYRHLTQAPAKLPLTIASFVGAIVGGGLMALLSKGGVHSGGMSYPDLAAILLTAVGVIVAIFGGILALAAVWGFGQMKVEAVRSATDAALDETKAQIEDGAIRRYIEDEIEGRIAAIVASPDFERRIYNRVDQIVLGKPEDRLLEEDDLEERS